MLQWLAAVFLKWVDPNVPKGVRLRRALARHTITVIVKLVYIHTVKGKGTQVLVVPPPRGNGKHVCLPWEEVKPGEASTATLERLAQRVFKGGRLPDLEVGHYGYVEDGCSKVAVVYLVRPFKEPEDAMWRMVDQAINNSLVSPADREILRKAKPVWDKDQGRGQK